MKVLLTLLLLTSQLFAAGPIVQVGANYGVAISSTDVICLSPAETVSAEGQQYPCELLYQGPDVIDVSVLRCTGSNFHPVPIAPRSARVRECIRLIYGSNGHQVSLPILPATQVDINGRKYMGNMLLARLPGSEIGSPAINSQGELIGLLAQTDQKQAFLITHTAIVNALKMSQNGVKIPENRPNSPDNSRVLPPQRPVVLVFTSSWCLPCQELKNDLAGPLANLNRQYEFRFIDVEKQPQLATQYAIQSIPTLILPSGERIEGYEAGQGLTIPTQPTPTPDRDELPDDYRTGGLFSRMFRAAGRFTRGTLSLAWNYGPQIATIAGLSAVTGGSAVAWGPPALRAIGLLKTVSAVASKVSGKSSPPDTPRVVTVSTDNHKEAFDWAAVQMIVNEPGTRGAIKTLKSLIGQYKSGQSLNPFDD